MADLKSVTDNFWKSLTALLDDLTCLEVSTYVTYEGVKAQVNIPVKGQDTPALLQAYTKLDLDSDTTILLPVKKSGEDDLAIREALLNVHQEHVKLALQTRSALVEAMLKAIPSIKTL